MLFLEWIETVGGIWLVMSAIAFFFAAAILKTRPVAADSAVESTSCLADDLGLAPMDGRQLYQRRVAKKKPVSKVAAPLEKAA